MESNFNCIFLLLVGLGDCLYGTRKIERMFLVDCFLLKEILERVKTLKS